VGRADCDSVLARDLDRAGEPADLLYEIAGDRSRVIAGSASDNMHGFRAPQNLGRNRAEGRLEQATVGDALLERLSDCAGLLVDLLQHVVAVLPFLRRLSGELAVAHSSIDRVVVAVLDPKRSAANLRHVPLLEKDEAAGHGQKRGNVRSHEVLIDAETNDHRATLARDDYAIRLTLAHYGERVSASSWETMACTALSRSPVALR